MAPFGGTHIKQGEGERADVPPARGQPALNMVGLFYGLQSICHSGIKEGLEKHPNFFEKVTEIFFKTRLKKG